MASRKDRKNRRATQRRNRSRRGWSRRNRNAMMGGGPAPVGDNSMALPMQDSLRQGEQYANVHRAQHGGAAPYPEAVSGATLPSNMVAAARTGPLDIAIGQIQGMQDGGRRRRRGSRKARKGRKGSRKARKGSRRDRSRRNRRNHRGGALTGSPLSESSMLLPPGLEKQAALNYEWSLAKDPSAFAPKQ